MYYDFYFNISDLVMLIFFIGIAVFFFNMMKGRSTTKSTASVSSSTTSKPQVVPKSQMTEDIKATKTSRIVDAVSILDDLGSTSAGYRHYCELVGTSMASQGVTAPYSKRQVAYYDIKCYRVDATYGGGQQETLVAHEHSFDPVFFTDDSCDTPIYVDIESFGNNVILVNSTNHVEGPNSDFAKAFRSNAAASSKGTSGAYAMVAQTVERASNVLLGAWEALRRALKPRPVLQPAYALAGGGSLSGGSTDNVLGKNVVFASGGFGAPAPHGFSNSGRQRSSQPGIHVRIGMGGSRRPRNIDDFMGGMSGPWVMGGGGYGYPHQRPRTGTDPAEILLGMGLSAMLNSMNTAPQASTGNSSDSFLGFRLVENIVPLGSPVYCIGEIYRHGSDVYMSRSLAKDYPTSYFATKPEAEVLSAINSK